MSLSENEILLRCFYIENGLVPVRSFSEENVLDFVESLESLEPLERKKSHRKFRKIFKKMWKNYKGHDREILKLKFGIDEKKPNSLHLRRRRRWVHYSLARKLRHEHSKKNNII